MIVYGDPQFTVPAEVFLSKLRQQLRETRPESLDDLRAVLIAVGQLEQGVADLADPCQNTIELTQTATDRAAVAFCSVFGSASDEATRVAAKELKQVEALLNHFSQSEGASQVLRIKIPEGFAFYTLFPEQYCVAAARWAEQLVHRKGVLVIGIRSIGTTLSAVVAHTLRGFGCSAHRFTVRPSGHPFERTVAISPAQMGDAEFALVVDEGPGLSGSSMAAVAHALDDAGFSRDRIVFFPAHNGTPGPAATETVRDWWSTTPCCVTEPTEVRWHDAPLAESLCARTWELFAAEVHSIHDVSGGRWRHFAYGHEADWPAAFVRFERTKYLVELSDGRRVLWKFTGFGKGDVHSRVKASKGAGDARVSSQHRIEGVSPVASFRGFEAAPWVQGVRLCAGDANSRMIHALARYIIDVATEPLDAPDRVAAFERINDMLFWNTRKSFGAAAAETTRSLSASARSSAIEIARLSCGDGQLAPQEFVRARDGAISKIRHTGQDHTIVGKQPLLWAAASVLVEWDLNADQARQFIEALLHANVQCNDVALQFYCAAYAAFRLGMATMCATTDPLEGPRLQHAIDFYRAALSRSLEIESVVR
jgi:hypothetical protein